MNLREFSEKMRGAALRMPEVKKAALHKVGEKIRDEARALIGTENDAWAPLAESTVEEKDRLGFTGQVSGTDPLLRTGELRDSIEVGEVTPERVVIGSNDPIARYQEYGTTRIPPRPFIGTAVFQTEHEAVAILSEAIQRNLKGHTDG